MKVLAFIALIGAVQALEVSQRYSNRSRGVDYSKPRYDSLSKPRYGSSSGQRKLNLSRV